MVNSEELISLPAAGAVVGVCRQYAHRMYVRGELPGQAIAGRICVRHSDALRVKAERDKRSSARS